MVLDDEMLAEVTRSKRAQSTPSGFLSLPSRGASASCDHKDSSDMLRMAERWTKSQWPGSQSQLQPANLHASSFSERDCYA